LCVLARALNPDFGGLRVDDGPALAASPSGRSRRGGSSRCTVEGGDVLDIEVEPGALLLASATTAGARRDARSPALDALRGVRGEQRDDRAPPPLPGVPATAANRRLAWRACGRAGKRDRVAWCRPSSKRASGAAFEYAGVDAAASAPALSRRSSSKQISSADASHASRGFGDHVLRK
jgi:hypothetical protein